MYTLDQVYPQPGITHIKDAEYIFVKELVSTYKLKKLYGVTVPENSSYKGMAEMITCYYYNKHGYVSRLAWVEDVQVYDQEAYELRYFRVCKDCGEKVSQDEICPLCGSENMIYKPSTEETLEEDIIT